GSDTTTGSSGDTSSSPASTAAATTTSTDTTGGAATGAAGTTSSSAPATTTDSSAAPAAATPAPWALTLPTGQHAVSLAAGDGNVVVTVDGTAQSQPIGAVQNVTLTGGEGGSTFTLDPSLGAAGVPVTIDGSAGNNNYKVGDSFGNVNISTGSGDTLDFTNGAGTSAAIGHPDASTFTSSTGTLTVAGAAPQIDIGLSNPTAFTGGIKTAIDTISTTIDTAASSAPQLAAPIPLLDPTTVPSIDALVGL